jgi:hypothetical protein
MHFSVVVPVKASEVEVCDPADTQDVWDSCEGHIESAVKKFGDCECCGRSGHWDWYQIGGRWSGALDGYQPECDPKNYKPCTYCEQTGKRTFGEGGEPVECNACRGWTFELSWPTDWSYPRDVMSVRDFKAQGTYRKFFPYAYISIDEYGCVEDWNVLGYSFGEPREPEDLARRQGEFDAFIDGLEDGDYIAIVDCHY